MKQGTINSRDILRDETGTIYKQGALAAAVGYPASYRVAVASLGAQFVYKTFNKIDDLSCSRFFLNDNEDADVPLLTLESGRPVSDLQVLAFSIACEQELLGIAKLLKAANIEAFYSNRSENDPLIIIGGPLTFLDPHLVAPFADIVVVGQSDHTLEPLGKLLVREYGNRERLLENASRLSSSIYVPKLQKESVPEIDYKSPIKPISAVVRSPRSEFKNLFLVEASRGCNRRCAFCTMSKDTKPSVPFYPFSADDILSEIPSDALGVGLVGAAVTDHPDILFLVKTIVNSGKRVSLSSIRADCLTEELGIALKEGGLRTLTIAADGASERLRRTIKKGISKQHIMSAADLAHRLGFAGIKVYSMVGLPNETTDDIAEFAELLRYCSSKTRVSVTAQAFVPKPNTPMGNIPMESVSIIEKRLALLRKYTKGSVDILPTSPKRSYIDWKLAHGGFASADAAVAALKAGGDYAAWKRAIMEHIP